MLEVDCFGESVDKRERDLFVISASEVGSSRHRHMLVLTDCVYYTCVFYSSCESHVTIM